MPDFKPTAKNLTADVANDHVVTITLEGDSPNGRIVFRLTKDPEHGVLSGLDADRETKGDVTYTPKVGHAGEDSFRYRVKDDAGEESDEAVVLITVTAATTRTTLPAVSVTAAPVPAVVAPVAPAVTPAPAVLAAAPVATPVAPAPARITVYCPRCGYANALGAVFCQACGGSIAARPVAPVATVPTPPAVSVTATPAVVASPAALPVAPLAAIPATPPAVPPATTATPAATTALRACTGTGAPVAPLVAAPVTGYRKWKNWIWGASILIGGPGLIAVIWYLPALGSASPAASSTATAASGSAPLASAPAKASASVSVGQKAPAPLCPNGYVTIPATTKNTCRFLGYPSSEVHDEINTAPSPGHLLVCREKPTFEKGVGDINGFECHICWPTQVVPGEKTPATLAAPLLWGQDASRMRPAAWALQASGQPRYPDCTVGVQLVDCALVLNPDGSENNSGCNVQVAAVSTTE